VPRDLQNAFLLRPTDLRTNRTFGHTNRTKAIFCAPYIAKNHLSALPCAKCNNLRTFATNRTFWQQIAQKQDLCATNRKKPSFRTVVCEMWHKLWCPFRYSGFLCFVMLVLSRSDVQQWQKDGPFVTKTQKIIVGRD